MALPANAPVRQNIACKLSRRVAPGPSLACPVRPGRQNGWASAPSLLQHGPDRSHLARNPTPVSGIVARPCEARPNSRPCAPMVHYQPTHAVRANRLAPHPALLGSMPGQRATEAADGAGRRLDSFELVLDRPQVGPLEANPPGPLCLLASGHGCARADSGTRRRWRVIRAGPPGAVRDRWFRRGRRSRWSAGRLRRRGLR